MILERGKNLYMSRLRDPDEPDAGIIGMLLFFWRGSLRDHIDEPLA